MLAPGGCGKGRQPRLQTTTQVMSSEPQAPPPDEQAAPASAPFYRVLVAVLWSFFGIRKQAAGERDSVSIKLLHVIVAGVLAAAAIVATVVILVLFITRKG